MKKILFFGAMAAMLLGTASCSNEVDQPAMGDEVNAAFSVSMDGIESRTISDGLTVNELYFEVYEAKTEGETTTYTKLQSLSQKVAVANKTATVTTKLIKGKTYKFAFWAQKDGAYVATDLQNIAMNYANANDENRDAFFANVEKTVTAAFEENVTLKRPFAQINFGASDVDALMDISGFTSQLVVKNVPNKFNVLSGEASGNAEEVTLTATAVPARIPETLTVDGKDYTYISMNYILATPEKATKDITLKVMDGATEVKELPVAACPMQRNYRTNILGDILSVEGKFNITIDPIYNGDRQPEVVDIIAEPGHAVYNSIEYQSVREAMQAALVDKDEVKIELADGDYIGDDFLYTSGLKDANGVKVGDNKTISVMSKSGIPENVILRTLMMTSTVTLKVKDITLCNTTKEGTALKLSNMATTYGGNGENFMSQSSICMVWTYGSVEFENVIFQNDATDGTSIYTYWGTETMHVTAKNCTFTGNQYQRASQIYGRTVALFENCTFDKVYRYCACIHGGYNDIKWINNTVLETGLNSSKKCNAIEHGSATYHRKTTDPQDLIYVEGGNYPATGASFVPYTKAYDEQPILSGTMPDGSAAVWQ